MNIAKISFLYFLGGKKRKSIPFISKLINELATLLRNLELLLLWDITFIL